MIDEKAADDEIVRVKRGDEDSDDEEDEEEEEEEGEEEGFTTLAVIDDVRGNERANVTQPSWDNCRGRWENK